MSQRTVLGEKKKKDKPPQPKQTNKKATVVQILGTVNYFIFLKLNIFTPVKDWDQQAQFHFKLHFFSPP